MQAALAQHSLTPFHTGGRIETRRGSVFGEPESGGAEWHVVGIGSRLMQHDSLIEQTHAPGVVVGVAEKETVRMPRIGA